MIRKLKQWYKDLRIRNKIVVIFIPLVVIPLFLVSFLCNNIFTKRTIDKTIKNVSDNSSLIITRINGTIRNAESCANMLTLNINKVINENKNNMYSELSLNNKIAGEISKALVVFPEVDSVAFIEANENIYTTNSAMDKSKKDDLFYTMMKVINETNGINIWFPMERREFLVPHSDDVYISIGKCVIDLYSGDKQGNLVLNVKETAFSNIFKGMNDINNRNIFIMDDNNKIISSSNPEEVLSSMDNEELINLLNTKKQFSKIIKYKNEKMLITCKYMENMGWKLLTATPISEITKDVNEVTNSILVISLICIIFVLVGTGVLSKVISKPIVQLENSVSEIGKGNLDAEILIYSDDEIGVLSKEFKKMIFRLKELLKRVNYEQKKKREYELALINSQIKPHFLYNTLEIIYVLSDMGRTEEAKKTTKALGDFYRIALSKGNEFITIREEIKNVNDYLLIQSMRYGDVFDYEINIEEDILDNSIMKMTIQPLVENSIYHGLKYVDGFGHLIIQGYKDKDLIIIKVIDNGRGMDEKRIYEVLERGEHRKKSSFGLYSVNERIKLYFGEEYGLAIQSHIDEGTEIKVVIPQKEIG